VTSRTLELIALALSVIPVALCVVLGYRAGAGRILARGAPFLASYCALIVGMAAAFRARWFEPLGLATPVLIGIAAAIIVRLLWGNRRRAAEARETIRRLPTAERLAGALAGGLGGAVAAVLLWLVLLAAIPFVAPRSREPSSPETASPEKDLFRALVETANHGFIRHVPIVGPFEEELEALVSILETEPAVRAELVRRRDWSTIARLESFRAIREDESIFADIEAVRRGDLRALYRLQKNPRILDFISEDDVIRLVRETRPSALIEELGAIERERGRPGERR